MSELGLTLSTSTTCLLECSSPFSKKSKEADRSLGSPKILKDKEYSLLRMLLRRVENAQEEATEV